jgi:Xaa-Pro aminopeptidase
MFDKDIYIKRRKRLKESQHGGVLLFLGNEESPINYRDNTYHFRQDSTFLYYFGLKNPGLAAIIDLDENKEIIFGNEMTIDEIVWMGQLKTLKESCEETGITTVLPAKDLKEYLDKSLKNGRKIHFLPPYRAENKIRLNLLLGTDIFKTDEHSSLSFIKAVAAQRSVKTEEEIIEIEKAVNISVDMHIQALKMAKPGMRESDIAAALHQIALAAGGNLAYPVILTVHGEILHNHYHGNLLKNGQMVLNDSGAETATGYCGDLTRTFPVSKSFTGSQKDMYNIVLSAYQAAVGALKPGIRYLDIHYTACKTLAEGLKDLGLMKGDIAEAVEAGAHAMFFQCGTGHMMGLDVHDMEDLGEQYVGYNEKLKKEKHLFGLKSLRLGKELEKGYVLTVEPGIYINPALIDLWKSEDKFVEFINYKKLEEYRHFGGIRIEDNFLITDSGSRLLGKPLPVSITEIENIRAAAL